VLAAFKMYSNAEKVVDAGERGTCKEERGREKRKRGDKAKAERAGVRYRGRSEGSPAALTNTADYTAIPQCKPHFALSRPWVVKNTDHCQEENIGKEGRDPEEKPNDQGAGSGA
jgi:hypothetical protein